ncbi:hypothetical protein ACLB2K_014121 [Fragaria x ananassa]
MFSDNTQVQINLCGNTTTPDLGLPACVETVRSGRADPDHNHATEELSRPKVQSCHTITASTEPQNLATSDIHIQPITGTLSPSITATLSPSMFPGDVAPTPASPDPINQTPTTPTKEVMLSLLDPNSSPLTSKVKSCQCKSMVNTKKPPRRNQHIIMITTLAEGRATPPARFRRRDAPRSKEALHHSTTTEFNDLNTWFKKYCIKKNVIVIVLYFYY